MDTTTITTVSQQEESSKDFAAAAPTVFLRWEMSVKPPRHRDEALPMLRDEGWSLIEMAVTLLVIGVLMSIALTTYVGVDDVAQDRVVHSGLRTVLLVEHIYRGDYGVYTSDQGALLKIEPTLDFFSASTPVETVKVDVAAVRASEEICLFAQSRSGKWYAIYHTTTGGTLFGQSNPQDCGPDVATGFSPDGW